MTIIRARLIFLLQAFHAAKANFTLWNTCPPSRFRTRSILSSLPPGACSTLAWRHPHAPFKACTPLPASAHQNTPRRQRPLEDRRRTSRARIIAPRQRRPTRLGNSADHRGGGLYSHALCRSRCEPTYHRRLGPAGEDPRVQSLRRSHRTCGGSRTGGAQDKGGTRPVLTGRHANCPKRTVKGWCTRQTMRTLTPSARRGRVSSFRGPV